MKKMLLIMVGILFILTLAACANPIQPNINQIKESPEQECGEKTTYRFVTYIPLCDPNDIITLIRDTNQWIQNNKDEYEFIDSNVINATPIEDEYHHTMPSGIMIIHIPRER